MSKRALIVEDNQSLQGLFAKAIKNIGFEVAVASDGNAALFALEKDLPDIVLLDLSVPEVGGLDILKIIRARQAIYALKPRRVHVIIVTGNHRAQDSEVAELADLFLLKPVSIRDLTTLIQRLYMPQMVY